MAQITITGLRKRFDRGESYAVDGVDLTVQDGEVVALLGPSGCGKTTTLNLLAGFLKPDDGEIRVGERLLSSRAGVVPPGRRNMSRIFQPQGVGPHKPGSQSVAYGLEVRKVPRDEIARRVDRILETVHLQPL